MGCTNVRNTTRCSIIVNNGSDKKPNKYMISPIVLGQGRTGTVYAASLRLDSSSKVAIKVISKAKIENKVDEVLKEIEVLTQVSITNLNSNFILTTRYS
jgi:serine/threonine protein kinase